MKREKGITYIALIFMVVFIVAILVAGFFYMKDAFLGEQIETVRTNMLLTQAKLQILQENSVVKKDESILKGKKVAESKENEKVKEMLEKQILSEQEENFDSYYILQEQDLQEMGLSGIYFKRDNFYIVNYKTLEIIWTQGIKIGGKEYYKLSELEALEKEKNKVIEENEDI